MQEVEGCCDYTVGSTIKLQAVTECDQQWSKSDARRRAASGRPLHVINNSVSLVQTEERKKASYGMWSAAVQA